MDGRALREATGALQVSVGATLPSGAEASVCVCCSCGVSFVNRENKVLIGSEKVESPKGYLAYSATGTKQVGEKLPAPTRVTAHQTFTGRAKSQII